MKKSRCFTLEVDGAEVRVQGDPNMSLETERALIAVVRAGIQQLEKLEPPPLSDAQRRALLRLDAEPEGQAYPLRRTKLGTWIALCNLGLVSANTRIMGEATLVTITDRGRARAALEKNQDGLRAAKRWVKK